MKKGIKLLVIYFPVTLVGLQVAANLLFFIAPKVYFEYGFYLNTFLGTNVYFSLFLLAFTYMFKFCEVSRAAAIAECAFAVNYLLVQNDGLYNIMFQVIVGLVALVVTFRHFINKFPLCKFSLVWRFLGNVVQYGSCSKGLEVWERHNKNLILTQRHHVLTKRKS